MTNIQQPYWVKACILDDNPLSRQLGGFVWLENRPPEYERFARGLMVTTKLEMVEQKDCDDFFYHSNLTFHGMRGLVYPHMVELTNKFRMNREDIPIIEIGEEE